MESNTIDSDTRNGTDAYLANGVSSLSPSLRAALPASPPAYEMKFVLTPDQIDDVIAWANWRLGPDPHGDPNLGGAYHTTTLYLDTAADDVRHRRGWHRRRKLRVRRYGDAGWVFVEKKAKRSGQVSKERSRVLLPELSRFAAGGSACPGAWFADVANLRGLGPSAVVSYERVAFLGPSADGPIRLTLDRNLAFARASDWSLAGDGPALPFLVGRALLELKYQTTLPMAFKELIAEMRLTPRPASKYRLGRAALEGGIDA